MKITEESCRRKAGKRQQGSLICPARLIASFRATCLFIIIIFFFPINSFADDDYWYDSSDESELGYNIQGDEWGYKGENEHLRYNVMENEWEFAEDNEYLKYNIMEDEWEFAK